MALHVHCVTCTCIACHACAWTHARLRLCRARHGLLHLGRQGVVLLEMVHQGLARGRPQAWEAGGGKRGARRAAGGAAGGAVGGAVGVIVGVAAEAARLASFERSARFSLQVYSLRMGRGSRLALPARDVHRTCTAHAPHTRRTRAAHALHTRRTRAAHAPHTRRTRAAHASCVSPQADQIRSDQISCEWLCSLNALHATCST